METVTERLKLLEDLGYDKDLEVFEGELHTTEHTLLPLSYVHIDNIYRIEDDSDPTNQTIIYAIHCTKPETKGVLIDAFGLYTEGDKAEIIEKLNNLHLH